MKALKYMLILGVAAFANAGHIKHEDQKTHTLNGNTVATLASPSLGSQEFEVWKNSWAVGHSTPLHMQSTEKVYIFTKGEGKVIMGGTETRFAAPCTIVCPANQLHQFFNIGKDEIESFVIMGANSKIVNAQNETMFLPWR